MTYIMQLPIKKLTSQNVEAAQFRFIELHQSVATSKVINTSYPLISNNTNGPHEGVQYFSNSKDLIYCLQNLL